MASRYSWSTKKLVYQPAFVFFEVSRNIAQNAAESAQSQGFVIGQSNVVLALTARARQADMAATLSTRCITCNARAF